jgi:hypothetical protein
MNHTPQQTTLSVRIGDDVRRRLERARDLIVSKTGARVSTSQVAKRLLESAREDRLELVELLAHPTETLLQIRRKREAAYFLSRAEWAVLAHFARHGMEALSSKTPSPVSRDSIVAVLEAFLAVYDLRMDQTTAWDALYLDHLPSECRPATATRRGRSDCVSRDVLCQTVKETCRRLKEPGNHATIGMPLLVGRNLSVLLEDERLAGPDALNRALRPYGDSLWRLAARGHYVTTDRPLRDVAPVRNGPPLPAIPSMSERNYTLSFAHDQDRELSWLLSFPGALGPQYPIRGYAAINEFRAMVAALSADGPTRVWSGGRFSGYIADAQPEDVTIWFRAHDNGITFRLSEEDWQSVRALVDRAWRIPDIRAACDALVLEYGEL